MRQLAIVSLVDQMGRKIKNGELPSECENSNINYKKKFDDFLKMAKQAKIDKGPEKPVLLGKHILDVVDPGPQMGKFLKKAYEIQIEEGVQDVEELKRRVFLEKH